jgi:membrane protein DedA with SNARE-associated domain
MEHQTAIYFLIMVALVLGIGNSYYIAKYLVRPRFVKHTGKANKNANKPTNIQE